MNANRTTVQIVTVMLIVLITLVVTIAHAMRVILEMAKLAQVCLMYLYLVFC